MNSINLASETKVLYNKGVTPKLKCVLILHLQIILPFLFEMTIWHIPQIDPSIPYLFKYLQKYPVSFKFWPISLYP